MGRNRKYSLNEKYFEKINTKKQAYILGFIYADGSVYNNYLTIVISKKDIEILKLIKSELEYTGVFFIRRVKNVEYVGLCICSKKIIYDLNKLGVIKRKTYESKKLPTIKKSLISSMLLGFFDGDGSIFHGVYKNKKEYCVCFSNNFWVLKQIKEYLLDNEISSGKIRKRYLNNFSCMLEIKGSFNISKIYGLLYHENVFSLKRKREKFDEFNIHVDQIKRRPILKEKINKIKKQYCCGKKQIEISKNLKMEYSSVRTIIQRLRKNGEIE